MKLRLESSASANKLSYSPEFNTFLDTTKNYILPQEYD